LRASFRRSQPPLSIARSREARARKLYPKAADTLCRDWERMVSFYSFPKDHWTHLRTTNPVESPFSAVRLRTDAAKRFKKVAHAEALI
jgi:putative transposase